MSCTVNNIKIEPVNVYWQDFHEFLVTAVADSSDSLDGTYFTFDDPTTGYYVWFNSSVGVAADPAPAGRTGITVAYDPNDSAATIAGLIQAAVDANGNWQASVSGSDVTITAIAIGERGAAPADVDSGMTITECTIGGDQDLGLLDGDVETTFEETLFEVTAHQYGVTKLADLQQGVSATVALTLKESDSTKLKQMFAKAAGGTHTPAGGTELYGWGTSNQGANTYSKARRLVLKPVGASDDSGNLTFWKAYPMPGSLVFSGENPKTLSVEFKIYRDETKPDAIEYFAFGDQTQLNPA